MDSYIPPNNTTGDRFQNPLASINVRSAGKTPFNNTQETRPLKMEQVLPDGRHNISGYEQNYQALPQNMIPENQQFQNIMQQNQRPQLQTNVQQNQQSHQQNNMQQNQQSHQQNMQQQQNLRYQMNDPLKSQTNHSYNNYSQNDVAQNNQKGPRPPFEVQRIQMPSQMKVTGPQQPIRPSTVGPNGGMPLNHPNQPNHLRMEAPKTQNDRVQLNLQNQSENYNSQYSKNPIVNLIRKSSDLDISSSSMLNINQKPHEAAIKSQVEVQPPNTSSLAITESKPNLLNKQIPLLSAVETKSESNESTVLFAESHKKTESDKRENLSRTDAKTKEKNQEENKSSKIKDSCITSGVVQKNIKFFEENDTAKKPLTPITITPKKKEKITNVPPGVIKSEIHNNRYESGVDETPVIHPNLGSIFQIPRKVAKIPKLKSKKRSQKFKLIKRPFEETSNKKHRKRTLLNGVPKTSDFCSSYKSNNRKNRKTKIYSSKEELLAFFENTKSWRKLNRQGSNMNQNTMKDKVVHKPTTNGDIPTPKKIPSKLQTPSKKNPFLSPTKTPLKSPSVPGTPGTPGTKSLPKTPESPASETPLIKKVPMNKIQVGAAPSPNLKIVRSKVGSLANSAHKPGGGNIKIETHKIDVSKIQPKTEAKNDQYKPSGGDKKIQQVKLQWNAKSKVGSLENATYKPGGGDKKIESVKLDFKEKAKSKVGSKDNVKHVPGGGNIKIEKQKLEFKAQSKVGSLDNVKHKPGGGDIKIFDDKTYLRQVSGNSSEGRVSGTQAHKALSVVRELEGRSIPGTPIRKTSMKIKKSNTIDYFEESPKIKRITEVNATSVESKKDENLPAKIKVTYSKNSSSADEEPQNPVKLIKESANNLASVLKPNLSKKDVSDDPQTRKQGNGNETKNVLENISSAKNAKITENPKQISVSPNLSKGKSVLREDTEISKFSQDETPTMEKIGEMWGDKNAFGGKSNLLSTQHGEQSKELLQTSSENYRIGNSHQQVKSQNPNIKNVGQTNLNDSQPSNFYSNQNLQPEKISQNLSFAQNQQRPLFPSSLQEGYKMSPSQ